MTNPYMWQPSNRPGGEPPTLHCVIKGRYYRAVPREGTTGFWVWREGELLGFRATSDEAMATAKQHANGDRI